MLCSELIDTFSDAVPGLQWRPANPAHIIDCDTAIEADVSGCLTLVGWVSRGTYTVVALNHLREVVGMHKIDNVRDAIKLSLLDGCLWLSSQITQALKAISQGADGALLEALIA